MAQKVCIIIAEKNQRRDLWLYESPAQTAIFTGKASRIFIGTVLRECAYSWLRAISPTFRGLEGIGEQTMKDASNVLRIVGMILLGVFVFTVGVPLVLKVAGLTLGIISILIGLAVLLIKVAVVLAIGYLILVGVRALLR
jgi:hypothetical protein